MNAIKKLCRFLTRKPLTFLICGLLAVGSVIYSGYTARDMIEGREAGTWNLIGGQAIEPQNPLYIPEIPTQNEQMEGVCDTETSVFATERPIESSPSEQPDTEISEESVSVPGMLQKPAQSTESQTSKPQTKPQTESQTIKPSTQVTTKPPAQSTQKPSGSTSGGTSNQVTGWNVTYNQAKKMVKADSAYDYEDLYWLARIISAEAKGESFTGQIGVGTVVLNRVKSKQFPNTVKGVVFDKKYGTQFTPVANGSIYNTPTKSAVVAAKMCLDGYTLSGSVLYFLNPSIATSSWIQNNRKYAFRVGNHEFYH